MDSIEKAIVAMKQLFKYNVYGVDNSDARIAILALEKQIPKQPNYTYDEYYECVSCYSEIKEIVSYKNGKKTLTKPKYCQFCGQSIDWEE